MSRELNGWVRPRPLRIAFLVENGEHASLTLDGIFADCYSRWGGRFSLIAPCLGGRIVSQYWAWLEAFDPDIVYSYVPLSRADILEVHERLTPTEYHFHKLPEEPRLDVFGLKPSYRFKALSSLSTIFRLARNASDSIKIIDSYYSEPTSRFFTDNFGVYYACRDGSFYPPDARSAAELITVVSSENQKGLGRTTPTDLSIISTEQEATKLFAEGKATSLSLLSAFFAPRLDIRTLTRWSGSFNLVVGDTFEDRILFWNARLLIPSWLDPNLCAFRVSREQFDDANFLSALGDLLKRRNYVNAGSGGQSLLTIRSMSLSTPELDKTKDLLASTKPWYGIAAEGVASLADIVPPQNDLNHAREGNRFGGGLTFNARPEWTQFSWSRPAARPPVVVPDHLSDAPARQIFLDGCWSTDIGLEYDGPRPRLGENRWLLPRRWRLAGAFKTTLIGEPTLGGAEFLRRSRDGHIAVLVSVDHPIDKIEVPDAFQAIQYALTGDGRYAYTASEYAAARPTSKAVWMRLSNEARYLKGVLGMAGGIHRAARLLLHPFMLNEIARLGGTPNPPIDKVMPTVNRLGKRVSISPMFDLRSHQDRAALSDLILKASREMKSVQDCVSYEDLKVGWKAYRLKYWNDHPQEKVGGDEDEDAEWDAMEEATLEACLIEMRRRQMMFQGHQWNCRQCHHRNWVNVDALSSELSCEVCQSKIQLPVSIEWLFRPNEFLVESLRDHSSLSVIWTLSAMFERARRSLIFVEPSCFGFELESEQPGAEADLLVIMDGKAMLFEVKASWRALKSSDIPDLTELAIKLRPDVALLAIMEKNDNRLAAQIAAAKSRLSSEGIEFELLTLDNYQPRDDPYLYYEHEE